MIKSSGIKKDKPSSTGLNLADQWEYDEVTDISENFSSASQLNFIAPQQSESCDSTHNHDLENEISLDHQTIEPNLDTEIDILPVKLANTDDILDTDMSKEDLNDDFEHDLEEKQDDLGPLNDGTLSPPYDMDGGEDAGPSHGPPPHLLPSQDLFNHHQLLDVGRIDSGGDRGRGDGPLPLPQVGDLGGEDDEDEDDDDDDDDDVQAAAPEGAYDPADYEHLNVGEEINDLFSYITRYTPQAIELEHRLRPYIPDYIPAVGDIDAFIKIPRPDEEDSVVGLSVLDEPSAKQSDSTVLDLQLRAVAKHTTAKSVTVKTVDSAEKNPKIIEKWVRDISDLHRAKPPPTVHYTKRMPDIDTLMQEWPGEVEELLKEISLPTADLEGDLSQYVDLICAVLDIPTYRGRIQSLHILFTLYSAFKNSAHFRQLAEENYINNDAPDLLMLS